MFIDRIFILDRVSCEGCGLFICQPGQRFCASCDSDATADIEAQAMDVDLETELAAMWGDEQLRKSGAL